MDFDEDPLDLLEDDGDGVIEMGLFFDKEEENVGETRLPKTGCSVLLILSCSALAAVGYLFLKVVA